MRQRDHGLDIAGSTTGEGEEGWKLRDVEEFVEEGKNEMKCIIPKKPPRTMHVINVEATTTNTLPNCFITQSPIMSVIQQKRKSSEERS